MNTKWMQAAYHEALKAKDKNEVPVGAVILLNGKIIARAHNLRETKQSSICHAEILAIEKACRKLKTWRLENCDVYVTLEPCPMCAGALQQARVRTVYYGATDKKAGCISLGLGIHNHSKLNHRYTLTHLPTEECGTVLSAFFREKRKQSKAR